MSSVTAAQPLSVPLDLRRELFDPLIPWGISERLFKAMGEGASSLAYKRAEVLPTDPEWRFIWRYFHHDKPTKYGIRRVYCLHERHQMQAFEFNLGAMEREAGTFPPTWQSEPRSDQRALAIERWRRAASAFSPFETMESDGRRKSWKETKVLPLWHGSSKEVCESVGGIGFTYFGKISLGAKSSSDPQSTDDGFFGSGIYFTNSARYAADIYSKGHLLLAWVSMREPFPVVGDPAQQDMQALRGKGHYKSYNAHYVPVVPESSDPTCPLYYPAKRGEAATCDELVVFQKTQALPRFWVELEVELPHLMSPSHEPLFVNELMPHLFRALQHPEVERDQKLRNILNRELEALLTLAGDDYLEEGQQRLFKDLIRLIDGGGKIDKGAHGAIVGGRPSKGPALASSSSGEAKRAPLQEVLPATSLAPLALEMERVTLSSSSSLFSSIAFGKAKWESYIGEVGEEPPLPSNMEEILGAPCPFWKGKRVYETHLLTLVPKSVDGRPLNLTLLGDLVGRPRRGEKTGYYRFNLNDLGDPEAASSHWALMTRDLVPGSRKRSYEQQQELIHSLSQSRALPYGLPLRLDAAVSIFMEYISRGTALFGGTPLTYTRCKEKWKKNYQPCVGGFSEAGLGVNFNDCQEHLYIGAAAFCRF